MHMQKAQLSNPISVTPSPMSVSASLSASSPEHRSQTLPTLPIRPPKVLHSVQNEDIKILMLENISQEAVQAFRGQGYHVDHHKKALSEDELVAVIGKYHAIGIRSKTKITERVIKSSAKVIA